MKALVERVVQQVLEAELASFLQADSYERTSERRGHRNGYKPRVLKTRVGELELLVPKDREGQFQTELFERYQRSEKALLLAIMQMYVEGVSTRKVRDITEALCGLEIGKSQVSALAMKLDEEIRQWRERALEKSYPYLMIDARYEKVRRRGEVISQGVLIVVGISAEGFREVLGGVGVGFRERSELGRSVQRPEPARTARRAVCGLGRPQRNAQSHCPAFPGRALAALSGAFCAQRTQPHRCA
jgi:transposase-like protein